MFGPNEENARLRALHPDKAAMIAALPGRTYESIKYQASMLKIVKPQVPWTGSNLARLRKLYPTATRAELVAAFPDRTAAAIETQANLHHWARAPRPLKKIGFPLVDEIRHRARALNRTLIDVDREIGSARYFTKMKAKTFSPAWRHIAHAVKALGGELRIEWEPLTDD